MVLISLQKHLHSKQQLAKAVGVDKNSIQRWKTIYGQQGLEALLKDKRGGQRITVISTEVEEALSAKLTHPLEAPRSFTELWQWIKEHYLPEINYHTLKGYVIRKYGAKIKVVRKTHINKDDQQVQEFKKK